MSSPLPPPPPPVAPAPAPRKGLHPLAWVAIGCAGLLLLVLIGFFAAGAFFVHKAKGWVEKAEANPAMAAAELVVKMNPDLTLVGKDEAAGTMTVRNKEGEEITLSFDEIANGKLTFEKDGESMEVGVTEGEGGGVRIQGPGGSAVFEAGGGGELPAWVPAYPGAEVTVLGTMTVGDARTGTASQLTEDGVEPVVAFFKEQMEALGLTVQTVAMDTAETRATLLSGSIEGRSLTVTVSPEDGRTRAQVVYSGKL